MAARDPAHPPAIFGTDIAPLLGKDLPALERCKLR
jgi:hypothetical protein